MKNSTQANMRDKLQIATLIITSATSIGLMYGRHEDHKRIQQLQAEINRTRLESAKTLNEVTLILERKGYAECKGDYECQHLYPHALKEVEAVEAAENRELEKKSTYKE